MKEKSGERKKNSPFFWSMDDGAVGNNLPRTVAASSSFKMDLYVASISGRSLFVTLKRSGIFDDLPFFLTFQLLFYA